MALRMEGEGKRMRGKNVTEREERKKTEEERSLRRRYK
jgi:hypothetical protein